MTALHTDSSATDRALCPRALRLGVVGFLNTVPLIDGLEELSNLEITRTVPSCLLAQLLTDKVELALCSSIDFQESPEPLIIIPASLLGCDGPTLTVRLYSSVPIHRLRRVYCDTDSHTSIILMRILLRELFDLDPELVEYDAREHIAANRPLKWPEAMMLIGDKVVTDSPPAVRYPHQLDLGAAWANLTGLPFVFAAWMARKKTPSERLRPIAAVLDRQRRQNHLRIDTIVRRHAPPRGWPCDLARQYLGELLAYDWTDRRCRGMERFFEKAHEHGLIESVRPLDVLEM